MVNTWENRKIASSLSNGTITFSNPTEWSVGPRWGYFLENKFSQLTKQGEWFFDTASRKLYLYSLQNPNNQTVRVCVFDYGIKPDYNATFITVSNISFEQQSVSGCWFQGSANGISITNCSFNHCEQYGVELGGNDDSISENHFVSNSTFTNMNGTAISCFHVNGALITKNVFKNIGIKPGYGISGTGGCMGVRIWDCSNVTFSLNKLDSIGSNVAGVNSDHCTIEKNISNHTQLTLNDMGALGSYGNRAHDNIFRNNILQNIHYNLEAADPQEFGVNVAGIYLDNYTTNSLVENNTIINSADKAIINNAAAVNNVYRGNVCYKFSKYGIECAD